MYIPSGLLFAKMRQLLFVFVFAFATTETLINQSWKSTPKPVTIKMITTALNGKLNRRAD